MINGILQGWGPGGKWIGEPVLIKSLWGPMGGGEMERDTDRVGEGRTGHEEKRQL